jgi:hypothetical protein
MKWKTDHCFNYEKAPGILTQFSSSNSLKLTAHDGIWSVDACAIFVHVYCIASFLRHLTWMNTEEGTSAAPATSKKRKTPDSSRVSTEASYYFDHQLEDMQV